MGTVGQFRLDKILTLFQDLASQHSALLGITGFDLAAKELMWVISRYQVKIHRHPKFSESLVLTTTRTTLKNLYEIKKFSIRDQNGHDIVTAQGVWVMVKKNNSKPVRLSTFFPKSLLTDQPKDLFEELFNPVPGLDRTDFEKSFNIRLHDLDMNRHVNNTVHVGWALDSLPVDYIFNYVPEQALIHFHKEVFYSNEIRSKTKIETFDNQLTTWHSLQNKSSNQNSASLIIQWSKV